MRREVKIGLTGICALVMLFFGIKFLKGSNLFQRTQTYYISFKNAKGLSKSSAVFADGYNIGVVGNIEYAKPGNVIVSIDVNPGVKIPHGTLARLDEAVLGGCTLNLTMGTNPDNCFAPGDTLLGSEANGLMGAAADLMPQAKQMLSHVDTLVMALNMLAANPNLPVILENTRLITENLNQSTQQLDKLLANDLPQLTRSLKSSATNLDTITGNVAQVDLKGMVSKLDKSIADLNETTAKLKNPDNNIGLLLNDTALYGNLNSSVQNLSVLLEDIKKNPSRYINVTVFGRKQKNN
ncbi:MAG: MlaD family protein [Bacteroidaceae bacterium]|nr:MlaD family protein [Prevotellaceae bacterium]MDY5631343.1 MlaD family protein [Bacteroidaceae bacterium]